MTPSLSRRASGVLVAAAVLLVAAPMILPGIEGEFGGTDDAASKVIEASRPGYEPWAKPFWTPPSKEIESLLFALQAAIGAGILGYVLGRRHGAAPRSRDVADR